MSRSAQPHDMRQVLRELRRHRRFAIASHVRGDGDSAGSEIALAAALRAMGKSAQVVKSDVIPPRYQFLARTWVKQGVSARTRVKADCVIVLDCPERERIGEPALAALPDRDQARWLSIDHHLGHTGFGHVNWVDARASSVGEMLYRLVRAGKLPLPALARDGLYVAIMTDTGQFAYSNTRPETLRIAAELVEAGADPAALASKVYEAKTAIEMELERRALASLEFSGRPHAGRVGWVSLSRRDFLAARDRAGLPGGPEHIQEVVNIPRRVAGVEVAALFYEPPGAKTTKVSLRSKGRFNVRAVAARFGGGGHQLAAGCELEKPLAATRKLVLAEIFKRLDGKVKSRGG